MNETIYSIERDEVRLEGENALRRKLTDDELDMAVELLQYGLGENLPTIYSAVFAEIEQQRKEKESEEKKKEMTRENFMEFFWDEDKYSTLTNEDRHAIFAHVLSGDSDFTKEFLQEVIDNYSVNNIKIIDTDEKDAK